MNNSNDNLIDLTGHHDDDGGDDPQSPQNKSTVTSASGKMKKSGKQKPKPQPAKKNQQVKQQKKTGKQPAQKQQAKQQQQKNPQQQQQQQQQQRNQLQPQQQQRIQQQQQAKKQQRGVSISVQVGRCAPTPVIASISTITNARASAVKPPPTPRPPPPPPQAPIGVDICDDIVDLVGEGDDSDHGNSGSKETVQNNHGGHEISPNASRKNNYKNTKSISFPHQQPPVVVVAAAATGKAQKNKAQKKSNNPLLQQQPPIMAAATGETENSNNNKTQPQERPGKRKRDKHQNVPSQINQRNGPAISRQPPQQQQWPHQHHNHDSVVTAAGAISQSITPRAFSYDEGPQGQHENRMNHDSGDVAVGVRANNRPETNMTQKQPPPQMDQWNRHGIPRQPQQQQQQQRQPHQQHGQQGNPRPYTSHGNPAAAAGQAATGQQHQGNDRHGADTRRDIVPSLRDHPTASSLHRSESHLTHNRPPPQMDHRNNRHAIPRQPQQQLGNHHHNYYSHGNSAVAARHGAMGQQHIGMDYHPGADARGFAQSKDSISDFHTFSFHRPDSHMAHNEQMDQRKRPAIPWQEHRQQGSTRQYSFHGKSAVPADRAPMSRDFSHAEDQQQQRVKNHHSAVPVLASVARGCASSNASFLHRPMAQEQPPRQQQQRQENGVAAVIAPRAFMPPKGSYASLLNPPENMAQQAGFQQQHQRPPPRWLAQAEKDPTLLRNEYCTNNMLTIRPTDSLPDQRCAPEDQTDTNLNQGTAESTLAGASRNGHSVGGNSSSELQQHHFHSANRQERVAVDRLEDECKLMKDGDSLVNPKSKKKRKKAKKKKQERQQDYHHCPDNQARGAEIASGDVSRSNQNNSVMREVVCGITNAGNSMDTQPNVFSGRNQPHFPHVTTLDLVSSNKSKLGNKPNEATMFNAIRSITSLRDRFYGDQQRHPTAIAYGSMREDSNVPADGGHERTDDSPPRKFQKVERREGIALAVDESTSHAEPNEASMFSANNNIVNLRDRFYGNQQRHPVSMADGRAGEYGHMSHNGHHRRSDDSPPPRKFQIVEQMEGIPFATEPQQPQVGKDSSLREAEEDRGGENTVSTAASSTSPFLINHHYYCRTARWELTRVAAPTGESRQQSESVHHQQHLSAKERLRERRKEIRRRKRREMRRRKRQGEDLNQHHNESSTGLNGEPPLLLEPSSPVASTNIVDTGLSEENPGEMRVVRQVDSISGESKQQRCDTDKYAQESGVPNPTKRGDIHQPASAKKNEGLEPQVMVKERKFHLAECSVQSIKGFHEVVETTFDSTSYAKEVSEKDISFAIASDRDEDDKSKSKSSGSGDRVGASSPSGCLNDMKPVDGTGVVEKSVDMSNMHASDADVVDSAGAATAVKATTARPTKTKMPNINATSHIIYEGPPRKKLDIKGGWPPDWIQRIYQRTTGQSKGVKDSYWFPPSKSNARYKLRSIVEVKRYIKTLDETGDEELAYASRNGESSGSNEAIKGKSIDKACRVECANEEGHVELSKLLAIDVDDDKEDTKSMDSKSDHVLSKSAALEHTDAHTDEVVNNRAPESDHLVPPGSTDSLTNKRPADESSVDADNIDSAEDSEKQVLSTDAFFGAMPIPENARDMVDLTKSDSQEADTGTEKLEKPLFSTGQSTEGHKAEERKASNGTSYAQLEQQNGDGDDSDDDMTLAQLAAKMKKKKRTVPRSSSQAVEVPDRVNGDTVDDDNVESLLKKPFITSKDAKPLGVSVCDIDVPKPECAAGYTVDRSNVLVNNSADIGLKSHVASGNDEHQQTISKVTQVGGTVPTDTAVETGLLPDNQNGEVQGTSVVPQHAFSGGTCVEMPQEQGTEHPIENAPLPDQTTIRGETKGDIINRDTYAPIAPLGENHVDKKSHENGAKDLTTSQNNQQIKLTLGTPLEPRDSVEVTIAEEITGTGQPQSDAAQDEEQADESKTIKKMRFLPRKPVPKRKRVLSKEFESQNVQESIRSIDETPSTTSSLQNLYKKTAQQISVESAKTGNEGQVEDKVPNKEKELDGQQHNSNDGRSRNVPVPDLDQQPKIDKSSDSPQPCATVDAGGQQKEGTDTATTNNDANTKAQSQSQSASVPAPVKKRFVPRKRKRSDEQTKTNLTEAETKAGPRTQSTGSDVSTKAENKDQTPTTTTASSSTTKHGECNFVMIDSEPDDDDDDNESGKPQRRTSKTRTGHPQQAPPKKPYAPKHTSHGHIFHGKKYHNINVLEEDAIKMQERMLKEAAERVRLLNLARKPISSTPGIPVIEYPIPNIEERYPDHWKWKDPYARLGLPHNATIKLVKSHWRRLARVYHPDKSNRPQTSAKFNAIAASYKKIADGS